jgi:hypothetical protein
MTQIAHNQQPDIVLTPSRKEWRKGIDRELAALGVTYDELAAQARARDFQSPEAMNLWVIIGEPQG